jgi:hypothetical protein
METKNAIYLPVIVILSTFFFSLSCEDATGAEAETFSGAVVDTGQSKCYDNNREISAPAVGGRFYGQDAQYDGAAFSYRDNGDGTVTDLNTGLVWQQTPDFDRRMSWYEALEYADALTLAGYDDWRLPTIKELTSIAAFDGSIETYTPYLDTRYFYFEYADPPYREIDAQFWSGNLYLGTIFGNDEGAFGFNFADAHIKAYPTNGGPGGGFFVRCVRGDSYGVNDFTDNGDGTVTDHNAGLMWQQLDDGVGRNWEEALAYAEALTLAGHDDWRLPNAKELQSIVDYNSKAPAIDSVFGVRDPTGWFWTSTTHGDDIGSAVYIAFGEATDYANVDVHGAGALRSDPKQGDPDNYPNGRGPQNDDVRIYNYVRCVRGAD